jgi:hypothetical protein
VSRKQRSGPTPVERSEIQKNQAFAKEAEARARVDQAKANAARLLSEVLDELLTSVSGSHNSKNFGIGPGSRDLLDDILCAKAYPPRYSGGGHRDGMKMPRRFSALTWVRAVPAVFDRFQIRNGASVVPPDFWNLDDNAAVIACPCGEQPVVPFARFHICSGEDCGRVFLFFGDEIRATRLSGDELTALADEAESSVPPRS